MPADGDRSGIDVRPLGGSDRAWARGYLTEHWGSEVQVANGDMMRPGDHEGFFAELDGDRVGLLTFRVHGDGVVEITSLHALVQGRGVGSAMLAAALATARARGAPRLRLVTTNDNVRALAFYQRRGMRLTTLRPGAVDASRALKPEIPLVAANGIPIRDELELELDLSVARSPGPGS